MPAFGRLLLWTVALLAPGGFLLLPVLFALRARAPAGEAAASALAGEAAARALAGEAAARALAGEAAAPTRAVRLTWSERLARVSVYSWLKRGRPVGYCTNS